MTVPSHREGFVLLAVSMALVTLAAIAFWMAREGAMETERAAGEVRASQARYVAEAGFRHAAWRVRQSDCSGYTALPATAFGPDSYAATVTPDSGSPVTITATGALTDSTQALYRGQVHSFATTLQSAVLQPGPAGKDTYLLAGGTLDFGVAPELEAEAGARHILLAFDVSSVPETARIETAQLVLRLEGVSGAGTASVSAHSVTRSWTEGTGNGVSTGDGATWTTYDGFDPWGVPGGDYSPTALDTQTVATGMPLYTWDVARAVRSWVRDAGLNHGLLLRVTGPGRPSFSSGDNASPLSHPTLLVGYLTECPPTTPPGATFTTTLSASADVDILSPLTPTPPYTAEDGEIQVPVADVAVCDFPARRNGIPGWSNWGTATLQEYANLVASDDAYYQTAQPSGVREAAMLFEFAVPGDTDGPFLMQFSGEAAQQVAGADEALRFCLWDYAEGRYDVLGSVTSATDTVVTRELVSPPGKYISASGQVTLFVVDGTTDQSFRVDTLSLTVTPTHLAYQAFDGEIDVSDAVIASGAFGARRDTIPGWLAWQEASDAEYVALRSSDDVRYQTATPLTHAAMLYEFYSTEDRDTVVAIDIRIEVAQGMPAQPIYFHLWDYQASHYDVLGSLASGTDAVFAASVTSAPARYVNPSDGQITLFLASQQDGDWIRADTVSVSLQLSQLAIGAPSGTSHALLRFDVLSTVPPGATIVSASLRLQEFSRTGLSFTVGAHKLTQAWTEVEASWLQADALTAWTGGGGGSYSATAVGTTTVNHTPAGWRIWDLTTLVQEWVDGISPDYGVILVPQAPAAGDFALLRSREGLIGETPELIVTYQP